VGGAEGIGEKRREIVKIAKFLYFGFKCVTNDIEG
jgi:hypothetical protein